MNPQRWSFAVPTALGPTQSSYEFTDAELRFESDDVFGGSQTLRWDGIGQAATAAMPGMGGPGMPDMPGWIPAKIEWLLVSQTGGREPFMRLLPQGGDRDALVAALQSKLGARWLGTGLPLQEAQSRLGVNPNTWSTLKVVGIVVAVMALMVLLIIVLGLLLHPVILVPACTAIGLWLIGKGRRGLRQAEAAAGMAAVPIARATQGPARLQGRVVGGTTTPSALTGLACLWWDVSVQAEYIDGDRNSEWRQIASRSGGSMDLVELEDDSGNILLWLNGAQLLMEGRSFLSTRDELPAHGRAFMESLGFPWNDARSLRVSESGLAAGATLYVIGTVDQRRAVSLAPPPDAIGRLVEALRNGSWRRSLVAAVPAPARIVVAVLIGYLDMMVNLGHGQDRSHPAVTAAALPDLPPTQRLVWQGAGGAPYIVSDHVAEQALLRWRRGSTWQIGIGIALIAFALWDLLDHFQS